MCGIFGFWKTSVLSNEDISFGIKCLDQLSHRGPDDDGIWSSKKYKIFFGHKRLSIIDINKRSRQPFKFRDLILNFNGEIYNYKEIKEKLIIKGHTFETNSDTEVLIHAWSEWGEKCLDIIDGMYAFAIFDNKNLWLVTDPFCEKPIFTYKNSDTLFFSSEPNVLIKELKLKVSLSENDINEFLTLGFLSTKTTCHPGLLSLSKGKIYKYDNSLRMEKKSYWKIPEKFVDKGKVHDFTKTEIQTFRDKLISSIRLRLRSDVSMGLFLSSGLDSSLIAALASRELDAKLTTFSMQYKDGVDETADAQKISKYLGLPNVKVNSSLDKSWKKAPEFLINLYGTLNDNLTSISFLQMSKLARTHFKVAICGLGGDELIYGYNKYHFFYKWRFLYTQNFFVKNLLRLIKPNMYSRFFKGSDLKRFLQIKNGGVLPYDFLKKIELSGIEKQFHNNHKLSFSSNLFDINSTLEKNYIPSVERASMRESLEVRSPFLSRDLFEFIASIDQRKFFKHGQKFLFKKLIKKYLPQELVNPKKRGFIFPINRYLKTVKNFECEKVPFISNDFFNYLLKNKYSDNFNRVFFRLIMIKEILKG